MPLTANNKVDVQALPAPAPHLSDELVHVGPRDRVEVQLTALWQQVLECPKIGIHDNFFDLGGHSLKAAQLFYLHRTGIWAPPSARHAVSSANHCRLTSVLTRRTVGAAMAIFGGNSAQRVGDPYFFGSGSGRRYFVALLSWRGYWARISRSMDYRRVDSMGKRHRLSRCRRWQGITSLRSALCRPQGPYVIIGACTGGLVAYEMAQQLVEQEEAITLIMMNSWHPASYLHIVISGRYGFRCRY